jgi:hypothetical protein
VPLISLNLSSVCFHGNTWPSSSKTTDESLTLRVSKSSLEIGSANTFRPDRTPQKAESLMPSKPFFLT